MVRSTSRSPDAVPALRQIVAKADPEQPLSDVRTFADIVAADTAPRSVQARVLAAFAAIAVLLAGIGIHGLLAFAVSSRAQEIGVRIALGAQARDVLTLVLRRGSSWPRAGSRWAWPSPTWRGGVWKPFSPESAPATPRPSSAAGSVSLVMVLLGSLLPALRAVRVDPLAAIRAE